MKHIRIVLLVSGTIFSLLGLVLVIHLFDPYISQVLSLIMHYTPKATWPYRYQQIGCGLLSIGVLFLVSSLWMIPRRAQITKKLSEMISGLDKELDHLFSRWMDTKEDRSLVNFDWPSFSWLDGVIVGIFIFFAALIFIGNLQGNYPYLLIGGDEANTASFAAGFDNPDLFKGDMLLGQTSNYGVYSTFNVSFMRWLYPVTGSYSLALTFLVPIQIFLFLSGFFLFGKILFKNTGWALLLTLLISTNIILNVGEEWGIINVGPVARSQFLATLPFILCLLLIWKNQPRRWPWIMAATGLLIYLHPISTPAWVVGIWLSLWFSAPSTWSFKKKLGVMMGMGSIFLVVTIPYLDTYLSNHVQGKSEEITLVYDIFVNFMPANMIYIPAYFTDFLMIILRNGLLPFSLIGFVATLILLRKNPGIIGIILLWMGSLLVISVFLTWLMQTIQRLFIMLPSTNELVRGIRYLIPWMLLFCIWPFYELSKRVYSKIIAKGVIVAGLVAVIGVQIISPQPVLVVKQAINCLDQGRFICPKVSDYDRVIQAVKEKTPAGALLYATFANESSLSYGMPFRFIALRPLVYAYKDRGMLVYTNDQALRRWYDIYQVVHDIEQSYSDSSRPTYLDLSERLTLHILLAKQLGAQYIVTNFKADSKTMEIESVTEIYSNPGFSLIQIK